jgi:RNase H-like domain found in reverse transcriptase
VQISDELSENILGIDFLQKFRLHLDPKTQQITFPPTPSKALFTTKNFTLPPFATALIQARTFQTINDKLNYIADIGVPKQPLISGPSTWVSFDHRKQCTLQIQNCAPHEVSIKAGDILGILDTEKDTPIPFSDQSLAIICEQIYQRLPKVKQRTWTSPLPTTALQAFQMLQTQLSKQPALAFPRTDQTYLLIIKAYTLDQDSPGGLCTTLAQKNETGKIQIISHASRQLKENEKNYTKFLLETAAAAWGMDNFNEYLNCTRFILYKDAITDTGLGTTQVKTLNRLKTTMSEHDFEIKDKQKSDFTDFLKKGQNDTTPGRVSQHVAFNKIIHIDTICTHNKPDKAIITIMDG